MVQSDGGAKRPLASTSSSPSKHTRKLDPFSTASVSGFFRIEDSCAMGFTSTKIDETKKILQDIKNEILINCGQPEKWKQREVKDSILIKAIKLRRYNRLSNFHNKMLKERLSISQSSIENRYLALQNIKSEISHLKKAIDVCLEFQASDSDIDLVSVEEFYKNAPDSIKPKNDDPHLLHLARLNYEMVERKNILSNINELEGRKNVLLSDIKGKEQRLIQLKPKISSLIESSKPVLDILGLKSIKPAAYENQNKAKFLPMQLNLMYVNAGVYQELFGDTNLIIRVDGDIHNLSSILNESNVKENDEFSRETETHTVQFLNKAINEDEVTEKDDGMEYKHRKHKIEKRLSTDQQILEQLAEKRKKLFNVHPVFLVLEILEPHILLTLRYNSGIGTVGLSCEFDQSDYVRKYFAGEQILDDLFNETDSGLQCPNPNSSVLLKMFDIQMSEFYAISGKQFRFLQNLCGLKFDDTELNPRQLDHTFQPGNKAPPSCMNFHQQQLKFFVEFIGRIKQRITSLIGICNALAEISCATNAGEFFYMKANPERFPPKILTKLSFFKSIPFEEFVGCNSYSDVQRIMVDELEKSNVLKSGVQFLAKFVRESFSIEAHIHVPISYPNSSPIFLLSIKSQHRNAIEYNTGILQLERFLNIDAPRMLNESGDKESSNDLFSFQIGFLLSRLDVVVEISSNQLKSSEFFIEHNYSRFSRGKKLEFPFKFDFSTNSFLFV